MDDLKIQFTKSLNVSERTKSNYILAINSSFVKNMLQEYCGTDNLFEITDLKTLWGIYLKVNQHPVNISSHRRHSAAIMKYIRFLNNGEKYGRRIDFGKTKNLSKRTLPGEKKRN